MHKFSAAVAITILSGITAVGLAADGGGKKGPPPRDGQGQSQGQGQGQGEGHRPPSPEEVFRHMDKNGDGKVSLEEFLAAPPPPPPPGKEGGQKRGGGDQGGQRKGGDQGQKKAGGDQGGQGGQRPEGKGRPSREEIFKHLDKDGDGFLTLEEFKAGRPPRPEGDGNKGGKRPPQGGDAQKKS